MKPITLKPFSRFIVTIWALCGFMNSYAQVFDIFPLYPYANAIVPSQPVAFQARTSDSLAPALNYVFQADTTDAFNSPLLLSQTINHAGATVYWSPQLPVITDSIVYFWRVSIDSAYNGAYNWHESAFQIITGTKGWGQAHFFQLKTNSFDSIFYNKQDRLLEFVKDKLALDVQTGVYPNILWNEQWYKLNGSVMYLWSNLWVTKDGIIFAVFNPVTGEPWYSYNSGNQLGQFGNLHGQSYDIPAFDFCTNNPPVSDSLRALITHFIDVVPDGHYILAYSHRNHHAQDFEETLYQAFESFGSAQIRFIQNNTPYIIFGKKGASIGAAQEVNGLSAQDIITLSDTLLIPRYEGTVVSDTIGPASQWHSLHWRLNSADTIWADTVRLSVLGHNINGNVDTLLHNLPPLTGYLDILSLDTLINPAIYPKLQLVLYINDSTFRTPAQLVRWQVMYEPAPIGLSVAEIHFNGNLTLYPNPCGNYLYADNISEGSVEIFNVNGQCVKSFRHKSGLLALEVHDLAAGTYTMMIQTEKGQITRKFVKN